MRYGSHSLRIGGATALYNATHDVEYVKRFGRWSSNSFSLYLWESRDSTKGLADKMLNCRGQLQVTHGMGAEVAARQAAQKKVRFNLDGLR